MRRRRSEPTSILNKLIDGLAMAVATNRIGAVVNAKEPRLFRRMVRLFISDHCGQLTFHQRGKQRQAQHTGWVGLQREEDIFAQAFRQALRGMSFL